MTRKQDTESYITEKNQPHLDPECNSSDAVQVYSDGHAHCYSCDTHIKDWAKHVEDAETVPVVKEKTAFEKQPSLEQLKAMPIKGFRDREIDKRITTHFGVTSVVDGDN